MGVWDETAANRQSRGVLSPTGAAGSNAGMDLQEDLEDSEFRKERARNLAKQLLHTHPDYDKNVKHWKKYLDLYESRDLSRFLHRHLRESDVSWRKRVERGYFYNYVASVVNLHTSYIFSGAIERTLPSNLEKLFLEEIYEDADRQGTPFRVFMQQVANFAQVGGHCGVLVDSPRSDRDTISEQERLDGKIRPYLTLFHNHQILDWELDDFGNFEWVKLALRRPQKRKWDQPFDDSATNILIWTKEEWKEYHVAKDEEGKETASLVDSDEHDLGEVPFVVTKFQKQADHPWFGVSTVKDISDINVALYNWSSLADEEIYERCLNILAMQAGDGDSKVELSHANVLEWEGEEPPKYLVPGETPLEQIRKHIEFSIAEILRLAKLKGPTGMEDVRQATSGIAYAFEFNETNQTLAFKAEALEKSEHEIHRLLAKWSDVEDFDGKIEYPQEFGVDDPLVDLQILSMARENLTSETAIKETEKKFSRKFFSKKDNKFRQKVESEIDAQPNPKPGLESAMGMFSPDGVPPRRPEREQFGGTASGEESESGPPLT